MHVLNTYNLRQKYGSSRGAFVARTATALVDLFMASTSEALRADEGTFPHQSQKHPLRDVGAHSDWVDFASSAFG